MNDDKNNESDYLYNYTFDADQYEFTYGFRIQSAKLLFSKSSALEIKCLAVTTDGKDHPADIRIIRPTDNPKDLRHMHDGFWGEIIDHDKEYVVICSIHAIVFNKLWDFFMRQEESFSTPFRLQFYCRSIEGENGRQHHKIDVYHLEGLAKTIEYRPQE